MNRICSEFPFAFVFFDDILIASKTKELHIEHLKELFECFQAFGLIINIDKCVFGKSELPFLGHLISPDGFRPNPTKVEAIVKMPPPQTITELRGFSASLNFYRDFISNAVDVQQHLSALTPGNKRNDRSHIVWTPTTLQMFEAAKN